MEIVKNYRPAYDKKVSEADYDSELSLALSTSAPDLRQAMEKAYLDKKAK